MIKDNNLVYGMRPVMEAIAAGKEIERLMLQQGLKGELVPGLRKLINDFSVPYQYVPAEKLNRLVRGNHQGVVCFISPISFQPVENLLMSVYEKGETPLFVILDRVTDVRNLGAIARSAECAGAHGLIIPERGGAPVNSDAIKTSAGALLSIPVCREENLGNALKFLVASGIKLVAASEKATKNYTQAILSEPIAFIMGAEDEGVSPDHLRLCDEMVSIPMSGNIASLNVSVATGVLLYEAVRQRSIVDAVIG